MNMNRRSCPSGTSSHTVRAGDTFFLLARANNITVDQMIQANPGVDPDRLFIGQVICIPSSTTTPPPSTNCPTLRMGSRGSDVRMVQEILRGRGYNPGPIDGIFGEETRRAVVAFQRSQGLTPDGIVGRMTWEALGVDCGTTPPPRRCPSGTFEYTIKSGDTFYKLANQYNTTVDAIRRANPNVNPNNLRVGQIICIPSASSSDCSNYPTVRKGSRGSYVMELQQRLRDAGFNPGPIDGIFGDQTEAAVMVLQRDHNLRQTGIVDSRTWVALCEENKPVESGCPSGTFPYNLRRGDTIQGIAREYNTTPRAIIRANPNVNFNNLRVDQMICIPR